MLRAIFINLTVNQIWIEFFGRMKRGGGDGPDPSDLTLWIRLCLHKFCFGDTLLADVCKISSRSVVINLNIKWRKAFSCDKKLQFTAHKILR